MSETEAKNSERADSMKIAFIASILAGILMLSGCSPKTLSYNGPEVTRILVFKDSRKMYLMHHDQALKVYDIGLGFAPSGHKEREGDGRTPIGDYIIDRRNPESRFHLSLGISYPNASDMARAQAMGVSPGGDIFIHGEPNGRNILTSDWTDGCIAVTNEEIREIYAMVRTGTPISLYDGPSPSARPVAASESPAAANVSADPGGQGDPIRTRSEQRRADP